MAPPESMYEKFRPTIMWLGLGELGWIVYWLLSPDDLTLGYLVTVIVWIVVMLGWLWWVVVAGTGGFFLKHTPWLSNLVGVLFVLAFAGILFGLIPPAREGLINAANSTSDLQLVSIHVLRLLAIGTVIKYLQGELPRHFVLLGSIPDFLFGASAGIVTYLAVPGPLDQNFLIVWHTVGFAFFVGAGVSMFFTMPSPFRVFHSQPDTSIVFQFPMLLAPNFTVPLFMLAHTFALVKLLSG